jgi:predicted NUDIX family NTP pyrophosphohydrolase
VPKSSAGFVIYRYRDHRLQVLLVHPGGPFYAKKDAGHWSIPKGEAQAGEDLLAAAKREFAEELGVEPTGDFVPLRPIKLKSGKVVHAWAVAGDIDTARIKSNTFSMEWPPRSGRQMEFPEVDRAEFFDLPTAREKLNPAYAPMLDELSESNPSELR